MTTDPKPAGDPALARSPQDGPWYWIGKSVDDLICDTFDGIGHVGAALNLYRALCRAASDAQSATFAAAQAHIARLSGLSDRSIRRLLPRLIEIGLVAVQANRLSGTKSALPSTFVLLRCIYARSLAMSGSQVRTSGTDVPTPPDMVSGPSGQDDFHPCPGSERTEKKGKEPENNLAPAKPSLAESQPELIPGTTETAKQPKERPRDPVFDALARSCGSNPLEMTAPQARACGVALAAIRKVCPTLTPEEIARRAKIYRESHKTWALTPSALCGHWGECGQAGPKRFPHRTEDYSKF